MPLGGAIISLLASVSGQALAEAAAPPPEPGQALVTPAAAGEPELVVARPSPGPSTADVDRVPAVALPAAETDQPRPALAGTDVGEPTSALEAMMLVAAATPPITAPTLSAPAPLVPEQVPAITAPTVELALVQPAPEPDPDRTFEFVPPPSPASATAESSGAAPVQLAMLSAAAPHPAITAPLQLAQAAPAPPRPPEESGITDQAPLDPPPPINPDGVIGTDPFGASADDPLLDGRRRPGIPQDEYQDPVTQNNPGALRPPAPEAFPVDQIPVPDRWRLIETLGIKKESWFDPYNQNTYKGDRPICIPTDEEQARRRRMREEARARGEKPPYGSARCRTPEWLGLTGDDWFFSVNAISDTVLEPRTFPIPVGVQTTENPDSNDVFGKNDSLVVNQAFIFGLGLTKGSTAYKPPDVEYRIAIAYNLNYVDLSERRVLFVEPSRGTDRFDKFLGLQELFIDYHLGNVSDRFDFDSVRVGIQPFQLDFRGFLFNDNQLGFRYFGTRDNNRIQYNLAGIWRIEKDTNSGLNDVTQPPRDDWILTANIYRQDFPLVGLTSQLSATYNINRERRELEVDKNGFPVRPALIGNLRARNYDVVYLGYAADGRIGKVNLSAQAYYAFGSDRDNIFTSRNADIRSFFFAAEPSIDTNFARFRGAFLFASGDSNPFNDVEGGFDAIFENPIFAGADTSYWIRQTIPFAGGGRVVSINGRNGILNSLRSSKEQGQSNFNNPGTILVGAGADFDLTPEFRISANLNHLWFEDTATLQALRVEGSIPKDIGFDLSVATIWRPQFTQNIVFRASAAVLEPGRGFKDLFANNDRDKRYYSVLLNAILTF